MIKSSHILVIKTTKNWSSIICKQQPYASWPLSYKQVTSLRFRNHNGKMMFVGRLGVKPSLMCPFHEMAMFLLHRSLSLHGHTMSCDLNFFFFYQNSQVMWPHRLACSWWFKDFFAMPIMLSWRWYHTITSNFGICQNTPLKTLSILRT